jgi:hypothetical protein
MDIPRQYPGLKKARLILAQLRVQGVEFPLFYAGGSNEATPFWKLDPSNLQYWWPYLVNYLDIHGGTNE